MTTPAETWNVYCDRSLSAEHAALFPAPPAPPDLLDFSFALCQIRLEAAHLARLFVSADECGAARGPTLRAHLDDLRRIHGEAAALVAEAEAEAAA